MRARLVGTLFYPDSDVSRAERAASGRVLALFPSGRPWIVSTRLEGTCHVASASVRGRVAALVGDHSLGDGEVERALESGSDDALASLHREMHGSAILAVFDNGRLWYRPSTFGSRRLAYTKCRDGVVCADHSFLLIDLADRPPDICSRACLPSFRTRAIPFN